MSSIKQTKVTLDQMEQHNLPPWAEWSDSYINNLQWSRTIKRTMTVVPSSPNIKAKVASESDESLFEDPAGLPEMPHEIQIDAWKYPHQINSHINYVIEPDPTPFDLVTYNKHLLHSEIMGKIISSITCLERESFYRPFPVEFQSQQFTANGGAAWKPWHHVYALTPAGKEQIHNPQYNPFGKYIVRLFFLGKWRRILVDDRLPVDSQSQILLPVSRPDNLWLPLLSKALLKVAYLSHCLDFSVIHCLTGWIQTVVSCKGCSMYQLWCVCCQLMGTTEEVVASAGCCRSDEQLTSPQGTTTGQSAVGSRVILAVITSKVATGISEHTVLISNVRYDSEQPSPRWKQYRWNEWAFSKGIISEIPNKPVRNIQIYNPLVDCSQLSSEGCVPVKSEVWLDFEEFSQNVRAMEVYYKPSYFKFSWRAWSEQELHSCPHVAEDILLVSKKTSPREKGGGDVKSTRSKQPKLENTEDATNLTNKLVSSKVTKKKSNKSKGVEDVAKFKEDWPENLRKSSCFYMLMDSMARKEVLCCVSGYSPEGPSYAIIFVGTFQWHSPCVAPITTRMSTTATSARYFLLPSGLRMFRIWHQFPSHFCMHIYSNTNFQCGSKMNIQKSLTSDSLSYKFYGREISSRFEQLLAAPHGGAGHGRAYQQLMSSLEPPLLSSRLPWPQWFCVHTELTSAFENCLMEMLIESSHSTGDVYQTIQAFQLLFLNPVFGMKTLETIKPEYFKYIEQQNESKRQQEFLREVEQKEQTAEEKGIKRKINDKSKRKPTDSFESKPDSKLKRTERVDKKTKDEPKFANEGDMLRKLIPCKEKSLLLNDQSQAIHLLQKMMSRVPHLRSLYPFYLEDDVKMVFRDYLGETLPVDSWLVLVRCVLNIHSTEPLPCSLHIWSPVENLILRLIDNDSNEDILPLCFVENNVAYLSRNQRGYTVFAYGVTDHLQPVPWRLRSMGVREGDCLHICEEDCDRCTNTQTSLPQQYQQTVHGYYVPNKQNIIARCLLEVVRDVTVLLRLHLSYKYADCRLTVTSERGDIVCDTNSTGQAMMVVLQLKGNASGMANKDSTGKEKLKPVVYKISAELMDNSWPLQPSQMKAMNYYKEHLPLILNRQTEKSSKRMGSFLESYHHSKEIQRKQSHLQSERSSSLKEDPEEINFENCHDKPSWSVTVVTDLQADIPVTLSLDTSLYEMMSELKIEWENQGLNLQNCRLLRQDFLKQLEVESEDDLSEDVVFKLKPKKLDRLTNVYGQQISDDSQHKEITCGSQTRVGSTSVSEQSLVMPSSSLETSTLKTPSSKESGKQPNQANVLVQQAAVHKALQNLREKTLETSTLKTPSSKESGKQPNQANVLVQQAAVHKALQNLREKTLETSTLKTPSSKESGKQPNQANVLVQQAAVHKALQNLREKTLDSYKQVFKETAELREKLLNDVKVAKEADIEYENSKVTTNTQKGNRSRATSPKNPKGKKTSVKQPKGLKKEKKGK